MIKNKFKKIAKILLIYLIIVIIINISFWFLLEIEFKPIVNLYYRGLVIKIKPLNYAMIFSEGDYITKCESFCESDCEYKCIKYHTMMYKHEIYQTKEFLDKLKGEGYTKIWGSWCHTGNYNYMIKYMNGTTIEWYDWVSRNKKPGRTLPFFTGFNFIRFSID